LVAVVVAEAKLGTEQVWVVLAALALVPAAEAAKG
jgi:hypothetical protein